MDRMQHVGHVTTLARLACVSFVRDSQRAFNGRLVHAYARSLDRYAEGFECGDAKGHGGDEEDQNHAHWA